MIDEAKADRLSDLTTTSVQTAVRPRPPQALRSYGRGTISPCKAFTAGRSTAAGTSGDPLAGMTVPTTNDSDRSLRVRRELDAEELALGL